MTDTQVAPTADLTAVDAIKAQQARQDRLEELYHQDGRHEPGHSMRSLYTGLVQQQEPQP